MNASEVEAALETEALVEQLRQMFRAGASVPPRHHHTVNVPDGADATLAAHAGLAGRPLYGRQDRHRVSRTTPERAFRR